MMGDEGVHSELNKLGGWFRMDRVVSKRRGGDNKISGQSNGQRRDRVGKPFNQIQIQID